MKIYAKSNSQLFKYAQVVILLTMTLTLTFGFIFPLSLFQSLVILPMLLLLQIGLLGVLEIKLDPEDKKAEVHHLSKRTLITNCHSKKAA